MAAEIIEKNPGVLVCSPEGLLKQSDEEIVKAADLVATLEANKPLISAVSGAFLLSIVLSVGFRIGVVNGNDMSPGGIAASVVESNPYFK